MKPADALAKYAARPRKLDAHLRKRSARAVRTPGTSVLVPGLIGIAAGLLAILESRASAEQPLLRLPGMAIGAVAGFFAADRGKRHVEQLRSAQRTLEQGPLVFGCILERNEDAPSEPQSARRWVLYSLDAASATEAEHLGALAARLRTARAAPDRQALGTTLFEALKSGEAPRPIRLPTAWSKEAYVVALELEPRDGDEGVVACIADPTTKIVIPV